MTTLENSNIKVSKSVLVFGILMILAGIFTWFNPDTALLAMALYLGIVFLLGGVGYLSAFFAYPSGGLLALGLLDIIVGVILVTNLGVTVSSLPVLLAIWVLCVGVIQIAFSIDARSSGLIFWKWTLASGIIGVLFGFLILSHPMIGVFTISLMLGLYLILYGCLGVGEYMAWKKLAEN